MKLFDSQLPKILRDSKLADLAGFPKAYSFNCYAVRWKTGHVSTCRKRQ